MKKFPDPQNPTFTTFTTFTKSTKSIFVRCIRKSENPQNPKIRKSTFRKPSIIQKVNLTRRADLKKWMRFSTWDSEKWMQSHDFKVPPDPEY